jgi:alanyl-tRNA synthetase
MTRPLYETDPYLSKFDAIVTKLEGDWVVLDRTAFFPGGGGQDTDLGWIEDLEVVEVTRVGDDMRHKVPDHTFSLGQRVECEVDWERRFDLMRGHSGEHLLFSVISKVNPDVELVKIGITPKKKSFIVRGDINWSLISIAQREANDAIAAQLPISDEWVAKDDPSLANTRIKLDRIHGDKVRIVKIGEIDKAACAGVHIHNTRELRMLLVTRLNSARPVGDFEIEFETGRHAQEDALRLAAFALQASDSMGAKPDDLVSAVENMKHELETSKTALKRYSKESLKGLTPEQVGDIEIYSGLFGGIDRKALADAANALIERPKTICVLGSADERLMLLVAASKDMDIDCRAVLTDALSRVSGKGGGAKNFASGGAPTAEGAEEVVRKAKEEAKAAARRA